MEAAQKAEVDKLQEAKNAQDKLLITAQQETKHEKDSLEKSTKKCKKLKEAKLSLKQEISALRLKVQEAAISNVQLIEENKHLKIMLNMQEKK
jgi:hypothetical protein